ncbi:MAG: Lipid A export ATP-binding/permease protein MsbA [Firmicutes bacterium ADurb.Bin354]|nr:MAG: Lipid A export ATP-binding/permease protein MsbA [Firmicutes bacterium ADurb.Bin354]
MFKTVKRIIDWCGDFKGSLYLGFLFSFLSSWAIAAPVGYSGYVIGGMIEDIRKGYGIAPSLAWKSFLAITLMVLGRFLFDYLKARCHEKIGYELVARDRMKIGEALKRVSLGYFQTNDTGAILNAITTGLATLENMGIRMLDGFIGGYLNFLCIFIFLLAVIPECALIALAGVLVSFIFLLMISKHSKDNTKILNSENEKLTRAALEYTRGLPVVKSFGMEGASVRDFTEACASAKKIALQIECGFIPYNCLHIFALKAASVWMLISVMYAGLAGKLELYMVLIVAFFTMSIFNSVEPIADSAHVLSVINNAFDKMEMFSDDHLLDAKGEDIKPKNYDIDFRNVEFSYSDAKKTENRKVLKDVTFDIPQGSTTAIVGPSGSGKTTICNLIARFYDVSKGEITLGGVDVKKYSLDSLLSNISMVFQNVYLFNDTIRANICFGRENVTEEEMIEAAKKARCHDFIMELPNGYDTVIGEGGGTLSGGQKQRVSIARAILKDSPIIILDESTASIDPENEHLIQGALTELSKGKTVIIIAHRLATIEAADQILVVDDGYIAEKGRHEELVSLGGKYAGFVNIRKQAENWQIA